MALAAGVLLTSRLASTMIGVPGAAGFQASMRRRWRRVRGSMPYLAVRGRRRDWEQWKRTFAEGRAQRQSLGIKSEQVFRGTEDPNEGLILFEVDDIERGRQAIQSPEAQQMRERSGVTEIRVYLPDA